MPAQKFTRLGKSCGDDLVLVRVRWIAEVTNLDHPMYRIRYTSDQQLSISIFLDKLLCRLARDKICEAFVTNEVPFIVFLYFMFC